MEAKVHTLNHITKFICTFFEHFETFFIYMRTNHTFAMLLKNIKNAK
jgi:hypothetical protein